jgi:translocation protein SEC63
VDTDKKRKYHAYAKETVYWEACLEKGDRLEQKDPWKKWRSRGCLALIFLGWILIAMIIYQISQFDYEMANFDPYEILQVIHLGSKQGFGSVSGSGSAWIRINLSC